jgi:hypothetical protein
MLARDSAPPWPAPIRHASNRHEPAPSIQRAFFSTLLEGKGMPEDVKVGTTGLTQEDAEHLRLLSIFHYVVAGLQVLMASFPIIHLIAC